MPLLGDRHIVCLDWDERSLRALDVSVSRMGVKVRAAVHVPIGPGTDAADPASMGEFLRRTLAEHRIRTRRAAIKLPRQAVVLNRLSLPNGKTDELAAMVQIQIGKELPYSKDQAVIDFAVSHEEGVGKCDVWVGAVRTSVIDQYERMMSAAGLKLERIGLRPYANVAAVTADGAPSGRMLTVDVGPSNTEINVIRDGQLVYSRAASVSIPMEGLEKPSPVRPVQAQPRETGDETIPLADEFLAPPSPMDALLVEVSRTIEAYRVADPGARIDRIVLAGSVGLRDGDAAVFEGRFRSPASVFSAPSSLKWRPEGGVSAAPFSAAIGLALTHAGDARTHFDFLHPKEPEAGSRERARRVPVVAGMAAVFVLAAVLAAVMPIYNRKSEIAVLEAQIKAVEEDVVPRKDFMKQYEDVEAWETRSIAWVDTLKHLAEALPPNKDASVTRIEFKEDGRGSIAYLAAGEETTFEIVGRLQAMEDEKGSPVFEAEPGGVEDSPHQLYSVTDEILLRVLKLKEAEEKKKRS